MDQCQPLPNYEIRPMWVQGIRIVPNGHTLVVFTIGTLQLATMATLHLRLLHKTKTCSFPANPGSKQLLQLGIHGDPAKCDLRKIMDKVK